MACLAKKGVWVCVGLYRMYGAGIHPLYHYKCVGLAVVGLALVGLVERDAGGVACRGEQAVSAPPGLGVWGGSHNTGFVARVIVC